MTRRHLPGLDGLRAFAVGLVVLFHQYVLPVGWVGVQIFFVLSGYLITRLLCSAKNQPLPEYLRTFYGRRTLRIFPLYFAAVALLALLTLAGLRLPGVAEGLPYAATYTYNFWYATRARDFSPLITHFWTLCVEEQFYLVWPFVIFFTPAKRLKAVLVTVIALGPVLRLLGTVYLARTGATQLFDARVALDVLTPTQLDAFATGAFVAVYPIGGAPRLLLLGLFSWLVAGVALVKHGHLPPTSFGYPIGMGSCYAYLWGYTLINICSALLIDCLTHRRILPALFEARPLAYLGRISYGLYVIHYPMQYALRLLLPRASMSIQLALQGALTIALASASFYLLEAPFLRLKERWFKPAVSPTGTSLL